MYQFDINVEDVKHANDTTTAIVVRFILDTDGTVIGFELVDDVLIQGTLVVENILEHVGVKGMKWGVRREATVGPQEVYCSCFKISR